MWIIVLLDRQKVGECWLCESWEQTLSRFSWLCEGFRNGSSANPEELDNLAVDKDYLLGDGVWACIRPVMKEKRVWTVEQVKEELPSIPVQFGGKVVQADVSGRKNAFASVWIDSRVWQFAWETLVHILNSGQPGLVS